MTEKGLIIIAIITIAICCTIGGLIGFFEFREEAVSSDVLEAEKQRLYEIEASTPKDLGALMANENISIDISSGDKIKLTFKEQHSKLIVTYSTEYELLKDEFICTDDTVANNIFVCVIGILLGALVSMLLLILELMVYCWIENYIESRGRQKKKAKKQKDKRNDVTVTQI